MEIKKRNLVEIGFSDKENETLYQAQEIIIQLVNSTDGNLLIDQHTGECFDREHLKNVANALRSLACNDYLTWLFEMD